MNDLYIGISILIVSTVMFIYSSLNKEEYIKTPSMKLEEIKLDFDKPKYPILKEPLFDDNFNIVLPEEGSPKLDLMKEKFKKIDTQSNDVKIMLKIKKAKQNALHINEKEKRL